MRLPFLGQNTTTELIIWTLIDTGLRVSELKVHITTRTLAAESVPDSGQRGGRTANGQNTELCPYPDEFNP